MQNLEGTVWEQNPLLCDAPSIDAHFVRFVLKNQDRLDKVEIAAQLGMSTTTCWRWRVRLEDKLEPK